MLINALDDEQIPFSTPEHFIAFIECLVDAVGENSQPVTCLQLQGIGRKIQVWRQAQGGSLVLLEGGCLAIANQAGTGVAGAAETELEAVQIENAQEQGDEHAVVVAAGERVVERGHGGGVGRAGPLPVLGRMAGQAGCGARNRWRKTARR